MAVKVRKVDRDQIRCMTLNEMVGFNNPIRIIDAFVDSLDLKAIGFVGTETAEAGRPKAADTGDLLKLVLYGSLHKIKSVRELAEACDYKMAHGRLPAQAFDNRGLHA